MTNEDKQKLKIAMIDYSQAHNLDLTRPDLVIQKAPDLWRACLATNVPGLEEFGFRRFVESIQRAASRQHVEEFVIYF